MANKNFYEYENMMKSDMWNLFVTFGNSAVAVDPRLT